MDDLIAKVMALLASGQLGYSVERVAQVTDSGRSLVYNALNSGALVGRKWGDRTIIPMWEVVRFLESLPAYKPSSNCGDVVHAAELPSADNPVEKGSSAMRRSEKSKKVSNV